MTEWSIFRGNSQQTGCSPDVGPVQGKVVWKTPLGRQWYSPPLLKNGRLYQVCPGRNKEKVICLDPASGAMIWEARASHSPPGAGAPAGIPARTRLTSRLVDLGNELLVRATNSDKIYRLSADDGSLLGEIGDNGTLNYRVHPAPILAGNSRYIFMPLGEESGSSLKAPQPKGKPWQWLQCKDAHTGKLKWLFRTGQFFSPVLPQEDCAYLGTYEGYFYCLNIHDQPEDADHPVFDPNWQQISPRRIRWAFKIDAPINSPAILVEGRIYFGANDGAVYCLDAASGAQLWRCDAGRTHTRAFIHFSKPLYQDGKLYLGSADNCLLCLDAENGNLLWKSQTPDWVRAQPVLEQGNLMVASLDGTLTCYAVNSGAPRKCWSQRLNAWGISCDLVAAEGRVYAVTSDMVLWCISVENGDMLWQRRLVDYPADWVAFDEFQSSPMATNQRIFIGTPGRCVAAIDRESGRLLWRFEMGGEVPGDPICVEGRVYIGQEGGEGDYYCLSAETGEVLWKQRLGWVWAAANYADGRLYVPGIDGNAYCLDASSGHILWSFAADSDLYMAPAIYQGREPGLVYFGSWDHWLYALDRVNGRLVWKFHARTYLDSGAPAVQPTVQDGRLFLPTMGPYFYCLDAQSGTVLWQFAPPNIWSTNTSPAVCGERVVMMAFHYKGYQGHPYEIWTYCLRADNGELIWKYPAGGLNGAVIADGKVMFGSTERGKHFYYCLDLEGSTSGGVTTCRWKIPLDFTVLESCTAVVGQQAYIYGEDGYLYAIE